jgi:DNA-binding transcriptional regulator YiaG
MAAQPARKARPPRSEELTASSAQSVESPSKRFGPKGVSAHHFGEEHEARELRAYTEEQVARMLQVSRSQLRKWRMGWSRGLPEGPPFKKMGRMIRYPELGLRTYIYGP